MALEQLHHQRPLKKRTLADYAVPENAKRGRYQSLEVLTEDDRKPVVRLQGPHHDSEPRVTVRGLTENEY